MKIQKTYMDFLESIENPPKVIIEAMKLGRENTNEVWGPKSNTVILALAKEAGLSWQQYNSDETPWCAIAETVVDLRAGKVVPFTGYARERANSFVEFGDHVDVPMLGDTCIFFRYDAHGKLIGYHVGKYIAEDATHYHIVGGNQSNQYNVVRIDKKRLKEARRPVYSIAQPESVKRYFWSATGEVSTNES